MNDTQKFHENLSAGVPVEISSYGDTSNLSALEFVESVGSSSREEVLGRCMQNALGFFRKDIAGSRVALLVHRLPWNAGGALSKRRGVWHSVSQELITVNFPNGVSNLIIPDSNDLWGYAECVVNRIDSLVQLVRSLDGIFVLTVQAFNQAKFIDILREHSKRGDGSSLHATMRYCELEPALLLWPYPSFDDPEVAIYVIGQQFRIAKAIHKASWL